MSVDTEDSSGVSGTVEGYTHSEQYRVQLEHTGLSSSHLKLSVDVARLHARADEVAEVK